MLDHVTHACHPSTRGWWKQEYQEFKANLSYTMRWRFGLHETLSP